MPQRIPDNESPEPTVNNNKEINEEVKDILSLLLNKGYSCYFNITDIYFFSSCNKYYFGIMLKRVRNISKE